MRVNKEAFLKIMSETVRATWHGSLVPDQTLNFFLGQCATHCIINGYFVSDMLVRWMESECDFSADEIAWVLNRLKERSRPIAFVNVLMPGEKPPETVLATNTTNLTANSGNNGTKSGLSPGGQGATVANSIEKGLELEEGAAPQYPEISITPLEAKEILSTIARSGPPQNPALTKIAVEKVLLSSYEIMLFRANIGGSAEAGTIRDALCWVLVLEADSINYRDAQKPPPRQSRMPDNTRILLGAANLILDSLKKIVDQCAREVRPADLRVIQGVQERLEQAIKKLSLIVETPSERTRKFTNDSIRKSA